ncbi:formyltetrahydrofolate deformylase [Sphingomonas sp. LM7]|uniref:formyltetrahydrofolate deformylase n=1 Tax=Sphingomonas sp. LM7 TaxID=1938607 RepID=UPI000983FFB1|nr:formyltetrahydrofolate deformylase [Sphingomonas sp. LM7]AQR74782.1 formyltetrahydrofolate deformylase [Sphingomonas sp. LM7]
MTASWLLTLDCADRPGIVAAVSGFLAERGGFILDSQQYADLDAERFFMRVEFKGVETPLGTDALREAFTPVADRLMLNWELSDTADRPRVLIAVSQGSHCLNDLLHRWQTRSLGVEIVGVVSNHEALRALTEWHGLPFTLLPSGKEAQETAMLDRFDTLGADYLILARYMQILSPALADRLAGRCINIHHSFLPSFKGARPYHRAHERGVKLIGATAHFVTSDLDEGPIIEQAVERIDHRASVDDMIRIGRDIEAQVLARAVQWVGARRVFLNGIRTIVFR